MDQTQIWEVEYQEMLQEQEQWEDDPYCDLGGEGGGA